MKILLIGHSIIDHLEIDGNESIKPGGVYYSTLGMRSIKRNEDKIFLLTGINENSFALFKKIYTGVNLDFSDKVKDMPEVFLRIFETKEREEVYKNISSRLIIDKVKNWNQFDGILINMITGYDLDLEQLRLIRNSYKGLIYFDVHTLSRGVDENMKREFRPIPESEMWLANIDILQCNENELRTVIDKVEAEAADNILKLGPKILIITKGDKGVTAYVRKKTEINRYNLEAGKVLAINKIGCGDIFGAVFFYSYLCAENILESLKLANKIAALSVSLNIIDNPEAIKNVK